jgi:subtilase family serine protease
MGWGGEISLDLDMVSAVCPNCHIILVEADSNSIGDLVSSVAEAVSLGANVVSDSWGIGEFEGETGYDADLDFPGVPITFSSGDGAYGSGVQYPSASPYVTSVGGTMLTPTSTGRKWSETAWVTKPEKGTQPVQGSGSGCSAFEAKPAWQADSGCTMRMTADVSAVAADVLSYDTYQTGGGGWYYTFGTSVSSPIVASIYALAGNALSVSSPSSIPYADPSTFYDITSGSEGKCTPKYFCKAGVGYDGPTGLGSPDGDGGF